MKTSLDTDIIGHIKSLLHSKKRYVMHVFW